MTVYRSAMGKVVDMAALVAKNQKTRAVGNMKVNARGDTIDSYGRVIQPVTEKVTNSYSKTVGNRSAQVTKSQVAKPSGPKTAAPPQKVTEELTDYEREMNNELEDDEAVIEAIKSKEKK